MVFDNYAKGIARTQLKRKRHTEYMQLFVDGSEPSTEANDIDNDQFAASLTKNLMIKCNMTLNRSLSPKHIKRVIISTLKIDIVNKIHQSLNGVDALCLTVDLS